MRAKLIMGLFIALQLLGSPQGVTVAHAQNVPTAQEQSAIRQVLHDFSKALEGYYGGVNRVAPNTSIVTAAFTTWQATNALKARLRTHDEWPALAAQFIELKVRFRGLRSEADTFHANSNYPDLAAQFVSLHQTYRLLRQTIREAAAD